ncbi:MAG TPA: MarP family serine protease [Acidimicrobiia bacterium]|nr:MarP family serine protease [Acidimicrobiia bacterium]
MNFLDLVVVLAAVAAGMLGYRLGFVRRGFSWVGLAAGTVLAVALVDDVADALRASPPRTRLLASLAFVVLLATIGQGIGFAIGSALHQRLGRAGAGVRQGDRVAGAALGVFGVLALMWLLIPALASSPGWPAGAVRNSAVARAIDRLAPPPPDQASTLGRLVGDESFPEVFDTLTSPDAGDPPEGGLPADVAARVARSVVKVEGVACDRVQDGTGFVAARDLVVTNAHVVAGESHTSVETPDGRRLDTVVVAFDPNRDLAVLRVQGLAMPALGFTTGAVDARGSLFGHPGGGDLRESPMRIAEQIVAEGTDIYRSASTERQVYVLAAVAAPGDSGAPVVDAQGQVLGVLFALDLSRPTTAYAVTDAELDAVLDPVLAGTTPVPGSTGPCLSE